jgi:hypothetical protein
MSVVDSPRSSRKQMTRQQFDVAVDNLIHDEGMPDDEPEREFYLRVLVAAGFIIRDRHGIPAGIEFHPTSTDLSDFLVGLDRVRRRRLKLIAEGLVTTEMGFH